jgi:transcriptional regulator with GAF, ATPase, and Fis domain
MELKGNDMVFSVAEQKFCEVPETINIDKAQMTHLRITELLAARRERLEHFAQADDDALTYVERAEIAPLTRTVEELARLSTEVSVVCMQQGIESYLRQRDNNN